MVFETFFKQFEYIEDKEHVEKAWRHHIYPQNNWEYNHPAGFIKIYKKHDDIFIDLFSGILCTETLKGIKLFNGSAH